MTTHALRLATAIGLAVTPLVSAWAADQPYVPCRDDAAKYALRSRELQEIVAADQADRPGNNLKPGALERDRERRMRVGAIFGEGCFKEARDYAAAALVYQHGDQPDHFMQTFLWAKHAVELGDAAQRDLMTKGIDRYLVHSGRKQLFGTQYFKPSLDPGTCWCLDQTEQSFPDDRRLAYTKDTYRAALTRLNEMNAGLKCPVKECERPLEATPKGSIPGFW